MQVTTHSKNNLQVAELTSDTILFITAEEGAQLIADLYYQGYDVIIVYSNHLNPGFFELKTGLAGEVLQKCSNWRMRMVIVGDFSIFNSKSLNDFIFESNKGRLVNFRESLEEALASIQAFNS